MKLQIKKYWLVSSIFYFAILLVDAFMGDPYLSFNLSLFALTLAIPFGYLFLEILNFIGLYLFSYKKNGTVLLTLNMILSIVRMCVITLPIWYWREVSAMYANQPEGQLVMDSLLSVLSFSLIFQWFVFSLKLRRENKLASKNEILAHPEHQRLLQELKAVNNLDELHLTYGSSVRNNPQIASALKKIYEQRRLDLSKS